MRHAIAYPTFIIMPQNLQATVNTLNQLPNVRVVEAYERVSDVGTLNVQGYYQSIAIEGDWQFVKFAITKQGYANIVNILLPREAEIIPCRFCIDGYKIQPTLETLNPFIKPPPAGELTQKLNPHLAYDPEFDLDAPVTIKPKIETFSTYSYVCPLIKRWTLGTSYVDIVRDTKKVLSQIEKPFLVVDNTGVGRAVIDIFRRAELKCPIIPVTITGGQVGRMIQTDSGSADKKIEWHVPKVELISVAQVILQTKRIGFAKGMSEAKTLAKELSDYRVKQKSKDSDTYDAREGAHDDILLSFALAAWWGERGGRKIRVY